MVCTHPAQHSRLPCARRSEDEAEPPVALHTRREHRLCERVRRAIEAVVESRRSDARRRVRYHWRAQLARRRIGKQVAIHRLLDRTLEASWLWIARESALKARIVFASRLVSHAHVRPAAGRRVVMHGALGGKVDPVGAEPAEQRLVYRRNHHALERMLLHRARDARGAHACIPCVHGGAKVVDRRAARERAHARPSAQRWRPCAGDRARRPPLAQCVAARRPPGP